MTIDKTLVTSANAVSEMDALKRLTFDGFNLQMFAEGDGDKGSSEGDADKGSGDGDADRGADKGSGDADKGEPKIYTEAHVKKIHAENANRRKENDDRRKENDDLKAKLQKIEEDRLKAEKKHEELAEKRAQERDEALAREKAANDRIATRAISSEIRELARKAGIVVEDAKTVDRLIDTAGCAYDAESEIVTGADAAVEAFKAANPSLFKDGKKAVDDKRGAPPPKKDGEPKGTDWQKADPKAFRDHMRSLGVTV